MQSLPHPLLSSAMARPHAVALQCGAQALTYAELTRAVRQRATLLAEHVQAGERIALWGPASIDWIVSFHALGWLGAAVAPLPPRAPLPEVQAALQASGATRLLCSAEAEPATGLAAQLIPSPQSHNATPEAPERPWPLDEVRWVLLTSGSTAAPRPISLTTGQLMFSAMGSALRLGHLPQDRWLLCLPLNHVGGLSILQRAMVCSTSVLLLPRWDAAQVAQAVCNGDINLVSFVPTMLDQVLRALPGPVPKALRAVVVGGAATTQELLERARAAGVPLCVTWGMTETASQSCTTYPDGWIAAGHVGPPLAFSRVTAPAGLLHVDGAQVQAPLLTRDRGTLDAESNVWVHGRADDVFISGGENIVPEELEAVLLAHADVADAAVVPEADAQWGERPVALLVAAPHAAPVDDASMRSWCESRLARFKVPVRFIWRPALPRNAMGKLNRRTLLARIHSPAP